MTGEVLNPVDIEQAIRGIANRIAAGVKVCSERYEAFLTADRVYDRAFAGALPGPRRRRARAEVRRRARHPQAAGDP